MVSDATRAKTDYEKMLRDDIEAIVFVRIPQIPSSRVWGSFPIASFDEFIARVPADREKWKIIPVPPRPVPVAIFKTGDQLGTSADGGWAIVALAFPLGFILMILQWRRAGRLRRAANRLPIN